MTKAIGIKAHIGRLKALSGPGAVQAADRALLACGELARTTAQIKITSGAVSGAGHVPSRPGEPPNQDTGVLANNITVRTVRSLLVLVISAALYAAYLEFGTSRMAERPYMRPTRDETAPQMRVIFALAMSAFVKTTRRSD